MENDYDTENHIHNTHFVQGRGLLEIDLVLMVAIIFSLVSLVLKSN